ncbi:hypothetical protein HDU96_010688 [Phlyctochytrium bullatum]|nr:hypothetical protein HDU96_010688 [Phlyctochytrium bullatum]
MLRLPCELHQPILAALNDLPLAIDVEWYLNLAHRGVSRINFKDRIDMFDDWTDSEADKAYPALYFSLHCTKVEDWSFRTAAWVLRFRTRDANTFAFGNLVAKRGWIRMLERILDRCSKESFNLQPSNPVIWSAKLSPETLRVAAQAGHLDIVKFLRRRCGLFISSAAIRAAVVGGHPYVVMHMLEQEEPGKAATQSEPKNQNRRKWRQEVFDAVCNAVQKRRNDDKFVDTLLKLPDVAEVIDDLRSSSLDRKRQLAESLASGGRIKALGSILASNPFIANTRCGGTLPPLEGLEFVIDAVNGFGGTCLQEIKNLLRIVSRLPCGLRRDSKPLDLGTGEGITVEVLNILETFVSLEIDGKFASQIVKIAAAFGRRNLLNWLCARREFEKAVRDKTFSYDSAIYAAAAHGSLDVIKFLQEKDQSYDMKPAIKRALVSKHFDITLFLLNRQLHSAKFVKTEFLGQAAAEGSLEIVAALLKIYPDVDRKNALDCAVRRGHFTIAKLLANTATKVDAVKQASPEKRIGCLLDSAENGNYEAIEILLQADAYAQPAGAPDDLSGQAGRFRFTRRNFGEAATLAMRGGHVGLAMKLIRGHNAYVPLSQLISKRCGMEQQDQDLQPFAAGLYHLIPAAELGHTNVVRFILGLEGLASGGQAMEEIQLFGIHDEQFLRYAVRLTARKACDKNRLDVLTSILEEPKFAEMFDINRLFLFVGKNCSFELAWYLYGVLRNKHGKVAAQLYGQKLLERENLADDMREYLRRQFSNSVEGEP